MIVYNLSRETTHTPKQYQKIDVHHSQLQYYHTNLVNVSLPSLHEWYISFDEQEGDSSTANIPVRSGVDILGPFN